MKNKNRELKYSFTQIGEGFSFSYNQNASVCDLIELYAKAVPDAIAVRFCNQVLTYSQLRVQVNQLANYLKKKGLMVGQRIATYFTPGLDQIISILAIFKIRCCYVPLDINYPIERLTFMINDCSVSYLLTQSTLVATFSAVKLPCMAIEDHWKAIKNQQTNLYVYNEPDDLAYIIYTSGSTGVPNGVMVHNRAVNNHMFWMKDYFQFTPNDKIILKTALSFDPSIWELLLAFYVGCELIVAPLGANMDPNLLAETIVRNDVTTLQVVPSFLKELIASKQMTKCQTLRHVFCGGESLSPIIKKLFFEQLNCALYNLYGPTETTIDISFHEIANTAYDINTNIIGRPIFNTTLYVVNAKQKLASLGEEGELYIGSDNLSKGYYNRDILTKERFINNPFEPKKYAKIYKTGDIVRWLTNSSLEYLGRNKDQIKINGVRIEPNELISILSKQPSVLDSLLVKKTDLHGYDYLACYLIPKECIKPFDISCVKSALRSKLPNYMLPKKYIMLEKFPLTHNGKVDISALPEPCFDKNLNSFADTANLTETEKKLFIIWQAILRNKIHFEDNFFEVGGTSLLTLKLLYKIQTTWDIKVSILELLTHATIKAQADLILSRCGTVITTKANLTVPIPNPIVTLHSEGTDTPLFLIHPIGGTLFWYYWLTKLLKKNRPIYGIQDPSIELERPVCNSITEMAAFYIKHIKEVQPNGKYLIGGASFGTTVAMEIAYLLEKEGDEVLSILNLDGWGVYPDNLYKDSYFRKSIKKQHEDLKKSFEQLALKETANLFEIQWHRLNLLKNYQVKNVNCSMALFKSQEILSIFQEIDSPFNHWDNFFKKEKLDCYLVPGNHETMFQKPNVETLASYMDSYLKMLDTEDIR